MILLNVKKLDKVLEELVRENVDISENIEFFNLSTDLSGGDTSFSFSATELVPDFSILHSYINGDKDARAKYEEYLLSDDGMCGVVNIMLGISNGKIPVMICTDIEIDVEFPYDLLDFIKDRYGVNWFEIKSLNNVQEIVHYAEAVKYNNILEEDISRVGSLITPDRKEDILNDMSFDELLDLIYDLGYTPERLRELFKDRPTKDELIEFLIKIRK